MLVAAVELRPAIERLDELDPDYSHLPSEDEWEDGRKVCECLKIFYDVTKRYSGFKYPASNLFFINVYDIRVMIKEWVATSDEFINTKGMKMQLKIDKYWEECNKLLNITSILDPQYKLVLVKYAYEVMYDSAANVHIQEVQLYLHDMDDEYAVKFRKVGSNVGEVSDPSRIILDSSTSQPRVLEQFKKFVAEANLSINAKKTDLGIFG